MFWFNSASDGVDVWHLRLDQEQLDSHVRFLCSCMTADNDEIVHQISVANLGGRWAQAYPPLLACSAGILLGSVSYRYELAIIHQVVTV